MNLNKTIQAITSFKGDPRLVARGLAIGILVGMTPFWGTHVLLSILFTTLFRGHLLSALLGSQITNIFTAPLIYPVCYFVGSLIVPSHQSFEFPEKFNLNALGALAGTVSNVLVTLTAGGMILGVPLACLAYAGAYRLASRMVK